MSSPEERDKILAEFRKQVEEEGILKPGDTVGTDDQTLLRFLRARKFDIKNAKTMLVKCQEWRRTVEGVGLDAIYDEIDPFDYPERDTVFKYWPLMFHKTDKKGRPLNIQFFGQMNATALLKEVPKDRQWKAFVANCEALTREVLPACSRARGEYVGAAYCIIDLKGFSLGSFWAMKGMVRDSFQISQDYYPETMGHVTIINAPATFSLIWSVVKPWLAPETVAKIDIQGSNYTPALLNDIDADNLPSVFGGSCTCSDAGGCRLSSRGPWLEGRVYHGRGSSKYRPKDPEALKTSNHTNSIKPNVVAEKTSSGVGVDVVETPEPMLDVQEVC